METLLPGFRSQAGFGFQRDVETHRVVLLFPAYRMSAGAHSRAGGPDAFEQELAAQNRRHDVRYFSVSSAASSVFS